MAIMRVEGEGTTELLDLVEGLWGVKVDARDLQSTLWRTNQQLESVLVAIGEVKSHVSMLDHRLDDLEHKVSLQCSQLEKLTIVVDLDHEMCDE